MAGLIGGPPASGKPVRTGPSPFPAEGGKKAGNTARGPGRETGAHGQPQVGTVTAKAALPCGCIRQNHPINPISSRGVISPKEL